MFVGTILDSTNHAILPSLQKVLLYITAIDILPDIPSFKILKKQETQENKLLCMYLIICLVEKKITNKNDL